MKHRLFPALSLLFGLLGLGCRYMLYAQGMDEKGLLMPSNPAYIALLVLTALAALCALLAAGTLREPNAAPDKTSGGVMRAVGLAIAGAASIYTALGEQSLGFAALVPVCRVFGVAAGVCLLFAALRSLRKEPVPFWTYAVPTLFCLLHAIARYPVWSAMPQTMRYVHALGAVLCCSLFFYAQTALVVSIAGRRLRMGSGCFGISCCLTAAANGDYPMLCVGCACAILCVLLTALPGEKEREDEAS